MGRDSSGPVLRKKATKSFGDRNIIKDILHEKQKLNEIKHHLLMPVGEVDNIDDIVPKTSELEKYCKQNTV